MSNAYHPKLLFQQDEAERLKWAKIAVDSTTHKAISYAQAQMAWLGYGPQHMDGINNFIQVLINLSESNPPDFKMPIRRLMADYGHTPAPPTSTTEPK